MLLPLRLNSCIQNKTKQNETPKLEEVSWVDKSCLGTKGDAHSIKSTTPSSGMSLCRELQIPFISPGVQAGFPFDHSHLLPPTAGWISRKHRQGRLGHSSCSAKGVESHRNNNLIMKGRIWPWFFLFPLLCVNTKTKSVTWSILREKGKG